MDSIQNTFYYSFRSKEALKIGKNNDKMEKYFPMMNIDLMRCALNSEFAYSLQEYCHLHMSLSVSKYVNKRIEKRKMKQKQENSKYLDFFPRTKDNKYGFVKYCYIYSSFAWRCQIFVFMLSINSNSSLVSISLYFL